MYTLYNNTSSDCKYLRYGMPQGSILGPVLFLTYINDIVRCSDKLKFLLYADDTTIFTQGRNVHELEHILNCELVNLSNWIKSNKLTLNISNTM